MQPNTLFKMEIQRMFLLFLFNLNCVVFSHLVWIHDIDGKRKSEVQEYNMVLLSLVLTK